MASRRRKKDRAKRLVSDVFPSLPPIGPLGPVNKVLQGAEALAQLLIEADPLRIITDDSQPNVAQERARTVTNMVNDPRIVIDEEMARIINDPDMMITFAGLMRIPRSTQFDRSNILPNLPADRRRTRKKTKTDKNMSKALRMANAKFRKKNGQLRKGATQAKIMKYAHRLLRKM